MKKTVNDLGQKRQPMHSPLFIKQTRIRILPILFVPLVGLFLASLSFLGSVQASPTVSDISNSSREPAAIDVSSIPTGTQNIDTPLSEFITYSGRIDVFTGGISFFPDLTQNSFNIDVPACNGGGTPVIHGAFLQWYTRWRSELGLADPLNGVPTFDDGLDVNINNIGATPYLIDQSAWGRFNSSAGRVYYRRNALIDITTQLNSDWQAGNNLITVSGADLPTPGPGSVGVSNTNNYGVGLHVFSECPEYEDQRVGYLTGLDWFFDEIDEPYAGDHSHPACFTFPPAAVTGAQIDIDAILSGQANAAPPYRGARVFYQSGSGPMPVANSTDPTGPADVIINGGTQIRTGFDTVWTSSLGQEWDQLNGENIVSVNPGDTWVCIQSESIQGGTSTRAMSGDLLGFAFSIPNDPTAVDLIYFRGTRSGEMEATLSWETATELDNFGFRLMRSNTGSLTNAEQISFVPSSISNGTGPGTSYAVVDQLSAPGRYTYWLVDIDTFGVETTHPPVSVTLGRGWQLFIPIIN